MHLDVVFWGLVIILAASITQGLTGFGFALVSVPILSMILPFDQVVPIVVSLSLLLNSLMLVSLFRYVEIKKIWLLIVSSFIGIPIGGFILLAVQSYVLQIIVGILILAFSIILLLRITYPIRKEYLAYPTTGIISGLLNSSISASGPPLVLFLSNQGKEKNVFKANLACFGCVLNITTLILFSFNGVLNGKVIHYTLFMLVAMVVGTVIGMGLASKVREEGFKKIVVYLLMVSSLWSILDGIINF